MPMSTAAWLVVVAVLLTVIGVLCLRIRHDRRNNFSPEQNILIKDLLEKELQRVRREKQDLLEDAARKGKTISTEGALRYAEELKGQYEASNRRETLE